MFVADAMAHDLWDREANRRVVCMKANQREHSDAKNPKTFQAQEKKYNSPNEKVQ